ncbi:MAG TPA: outer membrane beta-barrel protein [Rhodothermales bacterium]|nr:outer membrane beta-barrel protein [Rhodothermales bacterium]
MRRLLLFLLLCLLVFPVSAQRRWDRPRWTPVQSVTEGFFLEGNLNGTSISFDDDEDQGESESGGGLGLRLGYGFNRMIALYAGLNGAAIEPEEDSFEAITGEETFGVGTLDLGLQLSFGSARRALIPYLNIALSGATATFEIDNDAADGDLTLSGGALTLGGGLRYHFSPGLAVNVGLEGYGGEFTEAEFDGEVFGGNADFEDDIEDTEFSGSRLRIGLTWFPGAGRRR